MITDKVWQADDIKRHLLAVRSAVRAGTSPALVSDHDGRLMAYCQGGETALQYLASRFGVTLNGIQSTDQSPGNGSDIKTWTRDETKAILEEVKLIMLEAALIPPEQGRHDRFFKEGIQKTLAAVALSFRIMDLWE